MICGVCVRFRVWMARFDNGKSNPRAAHGGLSFDRHAKGGRSEAADEARDDGPLTASQVSSQKPCFALVTLVS